jgi:hypothetical protein
VSGLWWEKLASRRGTMALARIEAGEEVLSVPTSILLRSLLLLNRSLLLLNRSLLTRVYAVEAGEEVLSVPTYV